MLEIDQLILEIRCGPEDCLIEVFSSDRTDQPLDERM